MQKQSKEVKSHSRINGESKIFTQQTKPGKPITTNVSAGQKKMMLIRADWQSPPWYLYQALKESDEADLLVEHVYVYAFMKYYEDTANAVYQEMSGRAQAAVTKLSEKYAFLTPEILAIDEKKMQEYLNSDTLALYRHALEDILVKKDHALSEKEERLLAMAGQVTASPNEIFSKFNNADVKFGTILDEDGNEVELTNGRYSVFMESNNRSVREKAFKALYRQ